MRETVYVSLVVSLVLSGALIASGCRSSSEQQRERPSPTSTTEPAKPPAPAETSARPADTNPSLPDAARSARRSESAAGRGDETMPVAEMQTRLRDLGYNPGPIDGKTGKATTAALKSFQQDNALAASGHADAATIDKLRQPKAEARASAPPPTNPRPIANDVDPAIASCLKAWGAHPFGSSPSYKTLTTSVKVFGVGQNPADSERTASPSLVLVNPGVNVMGGKTLELLNPNGWYCLRSNVNVMGGVNIKAHCKAHLASSSDGVTVLGSSADTKGTTVLGKTRVTLVGCE